jgi:protein-tyrosine-phosphatase
MADTATPAPFKLLFVCVENSNRSQMSQAFAKILGGDKVESYSAGSKPSGIVNPKVRGGEREGGREGGRKGRRE